MRDEFDRVDDFDAPERQPLFREPGEAQPFPIGNLGKTLAGAIDGMREKTQAATAIVAQSALAAVNMAVQGHADVLLPTGQRRPISCFFISVAETGERKSAVDSLALVPVRQHEMDLRATYDEDFGRYKDQLSAYEKARGIIEKDSKMSRAETVAQLGQLGNPPAPPLLPYLLATEPTFEGLTGRHMRDGHPSLGVFSAEGGQFVGGHAMSQDNRLKTAAGLSGLWDGDPVRRIRSGEGATMLYGRRMALHLMIQPGVSAQVFSDPVLKDQGLLSRLLVVAPPPSGGNRLWREPDESAAINLGLFHSLMRHILKTPARTVDGRNNELDPRTLPMGEGAADLWKKYYNSVEARLGEGGEYRTIKGLANKLPEHAARLAATLALFDDLKASEVSAKWLAAGIELAEYYASEALRLIDIGALDPDLLLASKVSEWASQRGRFALKDLYQRGPGAVRDAKTARRIVAVLKDHGHVMEADGAYLFNSGETFRPARRASPVVGAI